MDLMNQDRGILENIQGRLTSLEEQVKLSREHDVEVTRTIKYEVNTTAEEVKDKVDELHDAIDNKKVIKLKGTPWWKRVFKPLVGRHSA